MLKPVLSAFCLLFGALPLTAHELWIDPETFQTQSNGTVNAALVNGQNFAGTSLAYNTRGIARLEMALAGSVLPIKGVLGDRPAIKVGPLADGLLVLAYQSNPLRLTYTEWDKFETFALKKGLKDPAKVHESMGIPFDRFYEAYTRYSKALIAVGSGRGQDHDFGFEAELLALQNPYDLKGAETLPVLLTYQNAPWPNAVVEVFMRDAQGTVTKDHLETDTDGIVRVPVQPGMEYMLDAVIFRDPSAALKSRMDVDWETLWANMTFSIPD